MVKKVVSLVTSGTWDIKKGRVYSVLEEEVSGYWIFNDNNKKTYICKSRFKPLEEEMEIKVGSEWVSSKGCLLEVIFVGDYVVVCRWKESGKEFTCSIKNHLRFYKPKPTRRTVWLNVHDYGTYSYETKEKADFCKSKQLLWQQEVELIDPRGGEKRMTGFTKGPWRVDDSVHGKEGGIVHIKSDGYSEMCTMFSSALENEGEFLANANLIAAAPDLHEALMSLLIEYDKLKLAEDEPESMISAHRNAKQALAKARGEK